MSALRFLFFRFVVLLMPPSDRALGFFLRETTFYQESKSFSVGRTPATKLKHTASLTSGGTLISSSIFADVSSFIQSIFLSSRYPRQFHGLPTCPNPVLYSGSASPLPLHRHSRRNLHFPSNRWRLRGDVRCLKFLPPWNCRSFLRVIPSHTVRPTMMAMIPNTIRITAGRALSRETFLAGFTKISWNSPIFYLGIIYLITHQIDSYDAGGLNIR